MQNASFLKRFVYRSLLPLGYRIARKRLELRRSLPLHWLILYWVYYLLLARSIQDKLGLRKVRILYSGGAPIGPEVLEYFHAVGIRIRELYGSTEASGISVVHQKDDIKIGTCGKPCPGVDIKISDEGEILTKSKSVFLGYFKDPDATRRTIIDGWLHLGDLGRLDEDGHLIMMGRKIDRIVIKGEPINPDNIENKLRFSPFIEEGIIIGDGKDFVSAIIQLEYANTGKWCQNKNLSYTTYFSLTQIPQVRELIKQEVLKVNEELTELEKVNKFVFLTKELDHDDDELTATRKVRRKVIKEKFGHIEEELYSKGKGISIYDVEGKK
jgi:long-chain acyl-CoA synthetase